MKKIEDMTPDEIKAKQQTELEEYTMKLYLEAERAKRREKKVYEKYKRYRKETDRVTAILKDHCQRYNLDIKYYTELLKHTP